MPIVEGKCIFQEKMDVFDVQRREVDGTRHFAKKRKMDEEQKKIFSTVCSAVKNQENEGDEAERVRMFVSGSAGVGKSFLIDTLADELTDLYGRNFFETQPAVVIAASTGIAALAVKGQTVHSLLSIPAEDMDNEEYLAPLSEQELAKKRAAFANVRLVIIDEISMLPNSMLAKVHARLCEIRGREDLFGGLNVLLFGDLLQLAPIGNRFLKRFDAEYQPPWIFKGWKPQNPAPDSFANLVSGKNFWESFEPFELTTNMRQKDDLQFAEMMFRVRVGNVTEQDLKDLEKRRVSDCSLVDYFLKLEKEDPTVMALFSTNQEVHDFNDEMIRRKCEGVQVIPAIDEKMSEASVLEEERRRKSPVKKRLTDVSLPESISVAEGARVMITWSLNPSACLVNRATGTLERIEKDSMGLVTALIIRFDKSLHELTRIERKSVLFRDGSRAFRRHQFPVVVSFGSTIHKSQGLTLSTVLLKPDRIFTGGQFYVGASRAMSLDGLHLAGSPVWMNGIMVDCCALGEYNKIRAHIGKQKIKDSTQIPDSFDDFKW